MTRDELDELIKRAELGDDTALEQLRTVMRTDRETWRRFGDLAQVVKQQIVSLMCGDDVVCREAISTELTALTSSLGADGSKPLHDLLVDQVVIARCDQMYHQMAAIQPRDSKRDTTYFDKRLDRAEDRFNRAIEQLQKFNIREASAGE